MSSIVGPKGHVFAFEAVPRNAEILTQNIELNGYCDRVTVNSCAVSDGLGESITLYAGPSSFEATTVSCGWETMMQVSALALDDYFLPNQRLDLVKMDIEGGEAAAVVGMRRLLTETRPFLLLEMHDWGWGAVDILLATNYKLYSLDMNPIDAGAGRGRFRWCLAAPIEKKEVLSQVI
ncbi:MAG: FkbM family methyltransferase [Candidatus Marsarchaeota archaeon]|nr:FkbM family methyltransferase [Candidatus Marsarchaeota archaeon]